jgi:CrcB protein
MKFSLCLVPNRLLKLMTSAILRGSIGFSRIREDFYVTVYRSRRWGLYRCLCEVRYYKADEQTPNATAVRDIAVKCDSGVSYGLIIGIERQTTTLPEHLKLFLMVGILGGLSTFSTFSMETVAYIENAQYLKATANIILNIALCFLFVFVGLLIAKYIKRFV